MGVIRLATRVTGKRVKVFLTGAGSVARGKELARHPKAQAAQACIRGAHGSDRKTQIRRCMAGI